MLPQLLNNLFQHRLKCMMHSQTGFELKQQTYLTGKAAPEPLQVSGSTPSTVPK